MSKNESAFPRSGYEQWEPMPGMSLRDYFAAKAMSGVIMNPDTAPELKGLNVSEGMELIARMAYMQADEMLAVREMSK